MLFILAIFACVVAHEFGHALAARRYGIRTPDITLLPIGGLARLERMPEKPREGIIVALAGPAVNVVIAAAMILALGARFDPEALQRLDNPALGFAVRLASVNVFLALFNLIPAFPMDGGRVLRAVLAIWYPRTQATNIAARIGQALAFGFGFLGLIGGNPLLIFIAIFVYLAATAEAQAVGLQDISRGLSVHDGMITRFESQGPQATIGDAAELLLRTTQHEFPVVDGAGKLRGFLTRNAMVQALSKDGAATPVVDVMTGDPPTVQSGARLGDALKHLTGRSAPAVGVVDWDGLLVGYVTSENIGELMMVENAGGRRGPSRPPPGRSCRNSSRLVGVAIGPHLANIDARPLQLNAVGEDRPEAVAAIAAAVIEVEHHRAAGGQNVVAEQALVPPLRIDLCAEEPDDVRA